MHYLNGDPGFCIIAPTAYLPSIAIKTKNHLVLAHLVDTCSEYAEFYRNLPEDNLIIMDNGAFELGGSYEPSKLIELGDKCGAQVIVLPDYPGKHHDVTIEAAEKWTSVIKKAGFGVMFVPQSEVGNDIGWMGAYSWATDNPEIDMIGMSILGIPNAMPYVERSFSRVVMTQRLVDMGLFDTSKHHHYLGLNSGPALEIPTLLRMGALDSCDSSGPVWAGICGHRYTKNSDSYLTCKKVQVEVDFDLGLSTKPEIIDNINHNVDMTLALFDTPTK